MNSFEKVDLFVRAANDVMNGSRKFRDCVYIMGNEMR